jgi:hypothetical protein
MEYVDQINDSDFVKSESKKTPDAPPKSGGAPVIICLNVVNIFLAVCIVLLLLLMVMVSMPDQLDVFGITNQGNWVIPVVLSCSTVLIVAGAAGIYYNSVPR